MQSNEPEVWLPVAGYGGSYEVSSLGRVRSRDRFDTIGRFRRGTILAQQSHPKTGHMQVYPSWRSDQQTRKVHHLVLEAFVGPRPPGCEGCHNDGNPANNRVENLRWDTSLSNSNDRYEHGTAFASHCRRGHPLTPENLYFTSGVRRCKACARASLKSSRSGVQVTQELADLEYQRVIQPSAERTHCKRGHLLSEENVYRRGSYWRCRECHRARRSDQARKTGRAYHTNR